MKKLIFPAFEHRVKQVGKKLLIFDVIRCDYVALSPEEWVRQHVIHLLIAFKKYPKSLFSVERELKVNRLLKRTDIIVYSKKILPFLLVECKAPEEKINETVLRQALIYNMEKKAEYICITNGIVVRIFRWIPGELHEMDDFPDWPDA
ncbi:MAG TPA: type I restriction enzyme HsdR N-terminal domain-containing protein [Cytophagales bacterium]|nr:type I restriction enzyme HsdR N-terminal domain-containing protein [Cytophagales bacterium]